MEEQGCIELIEECALRGKWAGVASLYVSHFFQIAIEGWLRIYMSFIVACECILVSLFSGVPDFPVVSSFFTVFLLLLILPPYIPTPVLVFPWLIYFFALLIS